MGVSNETSSVQRYPLAKTKPLYPTNTTATTQTYTRSQASTRAQQTYTRPQNYTRSQASTTAKPYMPPSAPRTTPQQPTTVSKSQPINIRSSAPNTAKKENRTQPPIPTTKVAEEPLRLPQLAEEVQQQPMSAPMPSNQAANSVPMEMPLHNTAPVIEEVIEAPLPTAPMEEPVAPTETPISQVSTPITKTVVAEAEKANVAPPMTPNMNANTSNTVVVAAMKKKKAALVVKEGKVNDCKVLLANLSLSPAFVAHSYDVPLKKIYQYNDLETGERLLADAPIYLEAKKRKARKGADTHTVKEGENMYSISQAYGIQLKSLKKRNLMTDTEREPMVGAQLYLRKKALEKPRLKK